MSATIKLCPLCDGTRRVKRRGYEQRCEPCDKQEIDALRAERDVLRPVLSAARQFLNGGEITRLVDAIVDYDLAGGGK